MILDKETELLTDYTTNTQLAYDFIKKRESIKIKIQNKMSKTVICLDDKNLLKSVTDSLIKIIEELESKNVLVIWKGIKYIWLVNYEKWLMTKNN